VQKLPVYGKASRTVADNNLIRLLAKKFNDIIIVSQETQQPKRNASVTTLEQGVKLEVMSWQNHRWSRLSIDISDQ